VGQIALVSPEWRGQLKAVGVDFRNAQPGRYVWHCHILEHEAHEMMRPYVIS
jgi:FtsP/CotA-like multicopper oxidase with cupredoxin domain